MRNDLNWDDLGRRIEDAVNWAVNSRNYEHLNQTIRQTVESAVDLGSEAVRKAAKTVQYQPPKTTVVRAPSVSHLYGKTGGRVVGGILMSVFGGLFTLASSIVTIVILIIGMFLMVPLRPVLESAVAQSASNYLLAALFGSIAVGFLAPQRGKQLWVCILPFVLTMVLAISGQLKSSMAMVMILVAIPLCIITGRILYKKGVIYFADTTKKAPEAAQESAEK